MDNQLDKGASNTLDFDGDPNALQRISFKLKETIFRIVALIARETELSVYLALLIPLIEFLQVVGFAFYSQTYQIWTLTSVQNGLHDFFQFFRLIRYIKDTNMTVYTIIFFLLLGLILLMIMVLAYSYYMTSRKKPTLHWPLLAIRVALYLSSSVLFFPIIDYFISIFSCSENSSGQLVHIYFSDTTCWKGLHLAMVIFAVIIAIIFLIITSIVTLTLFEARPVRDNFNSKMNARGLWLLNIHKTVLIIFFTIFNTTNYQIALITYMVIGSTVIFTMFQFYNPFYKEVISKAWSTMAALNLWTVLMLVFAKIMQSTEFDECVFVWILGIPLVLIVNINNIDKKMSYFLINTTKFNNGDEIINHAHYVQKLMAVQSHDNNAAVMLDGYLEMHKQDCYNEQCPCRDKSKTNNTLARNLYNNNEGITEKEVILIYLIYQLYLMGIRTFPNCIPLRISYSFFLCDKMSSKQQALQVLIEAEQRSPSVDQEFIVFRYKKLMEDDIGENQQQIHLQQVDNGIDMSNETSFLVHLRQCQANVEKSSLLHMEFWSQLTEDQPDLAKINELGSKISLSVKGVEDQWNKLMRINSNSAKAYRLYGKYLVEILHNKEKGEELLAKAGSLANMHAGNKNMNFMTNNKDLSDEATPTIIVSGEQERLGLINNLNLAASSLFGYTKNELINRKLSLLMPQIYARQHDAFMERFTHTNESTSKGKDRFVFGKTKSNYIFPFYYNARAVPSMAEGIQFIAALRVDKKLKSSAYVLTYPDGTIDGISSSCINILKIDKNIILRKPNIQDYIPNIMIDRYTLFNVATKGNKGACAQITFNYPRDSEYLSKGEPYETKIMCYLNDMIFLQGKEMVGFQFIFERMGDRTSDELQLVTKVNNFQFSYDYKSGIYYGEYAHKMSAALLHPGSMIAVESSDIVPSGVLLDTQPQEPGSPKRRKKSSEQDFGDEEGGPKRRDYGHGIKTYQLIKKHLFELEVGSSDEIEDEETENNLVNGTKNEDGMIENTVGENFEEEGDTADFANIIKSRKVVAAVVNDKTPDSNVRRLAWVVHLIGAVLLALLIWDYVSFVGKLNRMSKNMGYFNQANLMTAELMTALSNLRDLYLFKIGLLDDTTEAELRASMIKALYSADNIKEGIQNRNDALSSESLDVLNGITVSLRNSGGSTSVRGVIQATEDIISTGISLANEDLSTITPSNKDYYFVTYNLFNDYYIGLVKYGKVYMDEFVDLSTQSGFSIILLLFSLATCLGFAISVPVMYSIIRSQDQILRLFMDIPEKKVKSLYSKCEIFVSNLQIGEEGEVNSEIDADEIDRGNDDNVEGWLLKKKKKKFKDSRRTHRKFFIGFFILGVIMHGPLAYSFGQTNNTIKDVNSVAVEYNYTSLTEPFFNFARNVQLQVYIDSDQTVLGDTALNVAIKNINYMRDFYSLILSDNALNSGEHSDEYTAVFTQIFYENPCSLITGSVALLSCYTFANNTAALGMNLLLVRHFESLTLLLEAYETLEAGGAWPYDPAIVQAGIDSDTIKNYQLNLVNTPRGKEISPTQDIYISSTFRILNAEFQRTVDDRFDSTKTMKLLSLVVFIALLVVVYILIWIPYMAQLNNMIWKTKSMLIMIPIQIVVQVKSIRAYLRNVLSENHLNYY